MDLKKEFDELTDKLNQQRDEIQLQLHLASMEAKEEWQEAEGRWGSLSMP